MNSATEATVPLPQCEQPRSPSLIESRDQTVARLGMFPSTAAHTQVLLLPVSANLIDRPGQRMATSLQDETNKTDARQARLQSSIKDLQTQLLETENKLADILRQLRNIPARKHSAFAASRQTSDQEDRETIEQAQHAVKSHIQLLHEYNAIKDIGLGLMGIIADKEGKRLGEVMAERGVDEKD